MVKKIFILTKNSIYILLLIGSCSRAQNKSAYDSLGDNIRNGFEIIHFERKLDTLWFVSTNDFLYYPFGKFKNIQEIENKYPGIWQFSLANAYAYKDTTKKRQLHRLNAKNCELLLYFDSEKNILDLFFGKIGNNNAIKLINGFTVGISIRNFLEIILKKIPEKYIDNIAVVKFESGVTGIWHYYSFTNGVLTSIYMHSNHQLTIK